MEKWFIKTKKDPKIDFQKLNIDKYIYKILINREINTEEKIKKFLQPSIDNFNTPLLLPDLIKAANVISNAIKAKEKIRVIGDYDVDGVTSTYILVKGFERLGASVDYSIPHRVKDGYGINFRLIDKAIEDKIKLIVTCDNGIAAKEEATYAKENGIGLVITDHHEVPIGEGGKNVLPDALAVIDPKREISKYPFKDICGGVVAFKLISYLYKVNGIEDEELFDDFLEFAAVSTICDVMPLIDENRDIVKLGLEKLSISKNLGFKSIIQEAGIQDKDLSSYHIGFIIGPTINAAGRLDSAQRALELFLEKDSLEAKRKASYLRELNSKRQSLTDEGLKKIIAIIDKYKIASKFPILILREASIDESVVGIIAGRIKEKYNRPAIILTKSNDELKGSGRSIDTYNMFEKVSESKHLLKKFGGHAMACGLSLEENKFKDFVVDVNNKADLRKEDMVKNIYIDEKINISDINIKLAQDILSLEPFGNGNPKPLFVTQALRIKKFNVFGKNKNVIRMLLSDGLNEIEGLLFENIDVFLNKIGLDSQNAMMILNSQNNNFKLDLVFTPEINNFNGNIKVELKISNYRVSEAVK